MAVEVEEGSGGAGRRIFNSPVANTVFHASRREIFATRQTKYSIKCNVKIENCICLAAVYRRNHRHGIRNVRIAGLNRAK